MIIKRQKSYADLTGKLIKMSIDNSNRAVGRKYIQQLPKDVRRTLTKGNGHLVHLDKSGKVVDTTELAKHRLGR